MKTYFLKFLRAIFALVVHSKSKGLAVVDAALRAAAVTTPAVTLDEAADLVRAVGGLVRETATDGKLRLFVNKEMGWGTGTSKSMADTAVQVFENNPDLPSALHAAVFAAIDGRDIGEYIRFVEETPLPDDLQKWSDALGEDIKGFTLLNTLSSVMSRMLPYIPKTKTDVNAG